MAPVVKILGQAVPGGTITTLYTVPTLKRAVISSLVVQETAGNTATFQVYAVQSAGTAGVSNTIGYNLPLAASDRYGIREGWTLGPGETIQVSASTGDVTFTLFGEETDVPN